MTTSNYPRNIVWSVAIILAFLAVTVFPVNAEAYQYYSDNVPFFGNYLPEPTAPVYYPPAPYYPPVYYSPVSVSCYASPTSVTTGSSVTWTAYATGGNGSYTYSWSGDESLYGNGRTIYKSYGYAGYKSASVTVYSAGQSSTRTCSNSVSVSNPYIYNYQTPTYQYQYQQPYQYGYPVSNNAGLDIGCYADPSNSRINQPITWIVEVSGGVGPYTYSWTGTDGLTGSQSSVVKYYSTAGAKSAIVSVNSANGLSASRACSNQLNVTGAVSTYRAPTKVVAKPVATVTPTPVVSPVVETAAVQNVFSLAYVPWGWVMIMVILVLFATVLYLLFNKNKI